MSRRTKTPILSVDMLQKDGKKDKQTTHTYCGDWLTQTLAYLYVPSTGPITVAENARAIFIPNSLPLPTNMEFYRYVDGYSACEMSDNGFQTRCVKL